MDELKAILKQYIDKVKAEAFAEGWNACLEKMPKWIPVTERLYHGKWCAVYYDKLEPCDARVVAWMELPNPWKGEE